MQISLISDSQSQRLFSSAVWSRSCAIISNDFNLIYINIQFLEYHNEYTAPYSEWPPLHVWLLAGVGLLPITKIYWLLVLDRSVQLAQSSRLLLEWSDPPPCQQQAAASCIRVNIRVIIRVMLLTSCHLCIKLDPGDTHDTCYQFVINFSADWRVWREREQGQGDLSCMYCYWPWLYSIKIIARVQHDLLIKNYILKNGWVLTKANPGEGASFHFECCCCLSLNWEGGWGSVNCVVSTNPPITSHSIPLLETRAAPLPL